MRLESVALSAYWGARTGVSEFSGQVIVSCLADIQQPLRFGWQADYDDNSAKSGVGLVSWQ